MNDQSMAEPDGQPTDLRLMLWMPLPDNTDLIKRPASGSERIQHYFLSWLHSSGPSAAIFGKNYVMSREVRTGILQHLGE